MSFITRTLIMSDWLHFQAAESVFRTITIIINPIKAL